jgi:hypothetical protein
LWILFTHNYFSGVAEHGSTPELSALCWDHHQKLHSSQSLPQGPSDESSVVGNWLADPSRTTKPSASTASTASLSLSDAMSDLSLGLLYVAALFGEPEAHAMLMHR